MTRTFMIDPTELLVERLFLAAYDHGTDEGSEAEAGELHEMLRAFFGRPEITTLKKIPEFGHFRRDRGRRAAMIQ
jgi:hypothetical protein